MGLQPGTYKLRLAASPSPLVGLERVSREVPVPVLTRGEKNLWRVEQVGEEQYRLYILVNGVYYPLNAQGQDRDVVGNPDLSKPETWRITGPEGGPYEIHVNDLRRPSSVWTVYEPVGDFAPVVLDFLLEVPTPENQKWYFVSPDAEVNE